MQAAEFPMHRELADFEAFKVDQLLIHLLPALDVTDLA